MDELERDLFKKAFSTRKGLSFYIYQVLYEQTGYREISYIHVNTRTFGRYLLTFEMPATLI